MNIYIYITLNRLVAIGSRRELEYGIPRLYSPASSRRFFRRLSEISVRQNKLSIGIRGKPFSPVSSRRFL